MKPEDFELLTEDERSAYNNLVSNCFYDKDRPLKDLLTGSRVVCSPPVMDTDVDILVWGYKEFKEDLFFMGFDLCGIDYDATEFTAFRKGSLNILATTDQQYWDAMLAYTEAAKVLNIDSKSYRAQLAQSIRDIYKRYSAV